jgi:hypothetical protein
MEADIDWEVILRKIRSDFRAMREIRKGRDDFIGKIGIGAPVNVTTSTSAGGRPLVVSISSKKLPLTH